MSVLFVFVDGLGVGADDPGTNPVARARLPNLRTIVGHPATERDPTLPWWAAHPLDAALGVPGLPQSGTGQTALLTGRNAPALAGRHYGPYPDETCRRLLADCSIWRELRSAGKSVAFANAYPPQYLDRVHDGVGRMGAVARSAHQAGVPLRGVEELREGTALSAFFTNELWLSRLGIHDLPEISDAQAGEALASLTRTFDFVLYETYITDVVGHRGDLSEAVTVLTRLDSFLGGVLDGLGSDTTLVFASDHGNIEDMTAGRHTRNPVMAGWYGPASPPAWRRLTDVVPATMSALDVTRGARPDHISP